MAQVAWEKPVSAGAAAARGARTGSERLKFLIGGALILAAVAYLIISNTLSGARFYITVDDLVNSPEQYAGQTVRVSGAVIGETIRYDSQNLLIDFTVAHVPDRTDDLAQALHEAVADPTRNRIPVHVAGQVKPELLQNEAQAIMTGRMGEDGVFYVSDLQLACPTRFSEAGPDQAIAGDRAVLPTHPAIPPASSAGA
jgi:cytochrome c-type biogenesis protein CcmE